MVDIYSKSKRHEIMSRVKTTRTAPEEKVAKLLRTLGLRYRRNVKELAGKPDFVVPSAGTIIFVHGCFWHGHINCKRGTQPKSNVKFWNRKISQNKKRDTRNARHLRIEGWHVVTIWQCKLRYPNRVIRRLERYLCDSEEELR